MTTLSPHFVPSGYFCAVPWEAWKIKVFWAQLFALPEVFGICVQGLWGRREKERGFFFFLEERVFCLFLTRMLQWELLVLKKGMWPAEQLEKGAQKGSILSAYSAESCYCTAGNVAIPGSHIAIAIQNSPCAVTGHRDQPAAHTMLNRVHFDRRGDATVTWNVATTHTWSRCWCCLPDQEARARCLDSSTDLVFFHKCIPNCLNGFSKILE